MEELKSHENEGYLDHFFCKSTYQDFVYHYYVLEINMKNSIHNSRYMDF
jgi:hypothetical protein